MGIAIIKPMEPTNLYPDYKLVHTNENTTLTKSDLFQKIEFPSMLPETVFHQNRSRFSVFIIKRIMDILGAILGLILFSPIMIIVALLIKMTSRGPVFFFQNRVGLNGDIFRIIKFRSMKLNAESKTGAVWAEEGRGKADPRATRVGNLLRKTHLDELPQLFLVLSGKMTFVGPRPERPEFVSELSDIFNYYDERYYGLKPGITGIAQSYREIDPGFFVSNSKRSTRIGGAIQFSSKSLDETNEKLIFDHTYALAIQSNNAFMCCVLDIKIIFFTVYNIFKKLVRHSTQFSPNVTLSQPALHNIDKL